MILFDQRIWMSMCKRRDSSRRLPQWETLLLAGGLIPFLAITISVIKASGATALDAFLIDFLRSLFNVTPGWFNLVIRNVGYASFVISLFLGLVSPFYYLWKRRFWNAGLIFFCIWGSFIFWWIFIHIFDRVRPRPILIGELPGYPSGHALSMFTIYAVLLYLYGDQIQQRRLTRWAAFAWVVWALLNGLSRLYLEQHYPTDVLAGYALGAAWLGLTLLLFPRYDKLKPADSYKQNP
jgi:membrane-associated phospholipid phosphatase